MEVEPGSDSIRLTGFHPGPAAAMRRTWTPQRLRKRAQALWSREPIDRTGENEMANALSIPCPKCGQKFQKTIEWLKANKKHVCSRCKAEITIDSTKLFREIEEAKRKAVQTLRKALKG
jgi:DNA-directed RNA polymerase subunit RPC12/RpoP